MRIRHMLVLSLALLLCLCASAESEWPTVDYAVSNTTFVNSTLKLCVNYAKNEGKVISLTGFVTIGEEGEPFFVGRDYRCCGADTTPYGFYCLWDGEVPEADSWIEAAGYLTKYEDANGAECLALEIIAIRDAEEGERVVTS